MTSEQIDAIKNRAYQITKLANDLDILKKALQNFTECVAAAFAITDDKVFYSRRFNGRISDCSFESICYAQNIPGISVEIKQAIQEILERRIREVELKFSQFQ